MSAFENADIASIDIEDTDWAFPSLCLYSLCSLLDNSIVFLEHIFDGLNIGLLVVSLLFLPMPFGFDVVRIYHNFVA